MENAEREVGARVPLFFSFALFLGLVSGSFLHSFPLFFFSLFCSPFVFFVFRLFFSFCAFVFLCVVQPLFFSPPFLLSFFPIRFPVFPSQRYYFCSRQFVVIGGINSIDGSGGEG